jgi:hypothetical protein
VRGTEIASGLVDGAYTPESARLLHQPAIIEYLLRQIDVLPAGLQKDPLIADIRANLERSLAFVKAATPTDQDVKDLRQAMAAIVEEITKGSKES